MFWDRVERGKVRACGLCSLIDSHPLGRRGLPVVSLPVLTSPGH